MSEERKDEETKAEELAQEENRAEELPQEESLEQASQESTLKSEDEAKSAEAEEPNKPPALKKDADQEQSEGQEEGEFAQLSETDVLNLKIADLESQIAQLKEELARSLAETYNTSQEYSNYVKRSKAEIPSYKKEGRRSVLQLLLGVLDDIYAAEQAGELEGPFASIAQKLNHILATNFKMESYGQVGDEFDPQLHEALMAKESDEVSKPEIAQVLQPGYRWGEEVLRPCKVIVNNPT